MVRQGNTLACASCHTDAGMRKFGNPLVGSYVSFPQNCGREDKVANIQSRVNGCMERSMNASPPLIEPSSSPTPREQ